MAETPVFRNNGFPSVNVEELASLDEPDFDQMRSDRSQRTRQAMRAVDAGLTSQLLPQNRAVVSREEAAAVTVQKHFRGYVGRKAYAERLFLQFELEEAERQEKMLRQVAEGELLVENHKLEVLLDEGQTIRRNRDRYHICKVITIQRAWRAYRDRKSHHRSQQTHAYQPADATSIHHQPHHDPRKIPNYSSKPNNSNFSLAPSLADDDTTLRRTAINLDDIHLTDDDDGDDNVSDENSDTESASGTQTMTLSTPEENQDRRYATATANAAEVEGESQGQIEGRSGSQHHFYRETQGDGAQKSSAAAAAASTAQQAGKNQKDAEVEELHSQDESGHRLRSERQQQQQQPLAARAPGVARGGGTAGGGGGGGGGLQDSSCSECESLASDYSELGEPLRALEDELELVDREELQHYHSPHPPPSFLIPPLPPPSLSASTFYSSSSTASSAGLPSSSSSLVSRSCQAETLERREGESDEEFSRRVRKLNFLSLAQEFAELKRIKADACPIDFHLSQGGLARSLTLSSSSSVSSASSSSSLSLSLLPAPAGEPPAASSASLSLDDVRHQRPRLDLVGGGAGVSLDRDEEWDDSELATPTAATADSAISPLAMEQKRQVAASDRGAAAGRRRREGAGAVTTPTAPDFENVSRDSKGENSPAPFAPTAGENPSATAGKGENANSSASPPSTHSPSPSPAPGGSVVMRDHAARRALRTQPQNVRRAGSGSGSRSREGSAKRNSHHGGTPSREARASPGPDFAAAASRRMSQPVGDGDFEVFTMDSSVPAMNWDLLEQQLQLAAEEERNRREARQTDREEIRKKLAMGTDEDYYGGERAFKKPSLSTRLQGGMNLQICFVNETAAVTDAEPEVTSAGGDAGRTASSAAAAVSSSSSASSPPPSVMTTSPYYSSQSHHNLSWATSASASSVTATAMSATTTARTTAFSSSLSSGGGTPGTCSSSSPSSFLASSSSSSSSTPSPASQQTQSGPQGPKSRPKSDPGVLASQLSLPPSDESVQQRQQRLQQEARMALAQASNMARMQLEVERKTKKKSPIAQIVGVPELGDGRRMKISRKLLQEMNLAQLQVLVNDLHTQIENLNEELVHLLIERDDLHMEQDSMLVDIEDLTSFAQHMSETNNNKTTQNNRNSSLLNKRLK